MHAIDAIRTRRSVRQFSDRAVDRHVLSELIEDAAHAPYTPLARDGPWRFTAILGRERIARFGDRALAFARENRPQARGYEWTERPDFSVFHDAPAALVICGQSDYSLALEECTRAGQILDIAARARGLGLCWVGAPILWLRSEAGRAELRIDSGWQAFAAFALGYAADGEGPERPPHPPAPINWIE